jgi:hypothetical protein
MQDKLGHHRLRTAQLFLSTALLTLIASQPAAASHGSLGCSPSSSFEPLFQLLHSVTELAFIAGVALATFGFAFAGIAFMIPGEEWNRRGKLAAKNVLIGTIILLSSNMVVSFLTGQLGGVIC